MRFGSHFIETSFPAISHCNRSPIRAYRSRLNAREKIRNGLAFTVLTRSVILGEINMKLLAAVALGLTAGVLPAAADSRDLALDRISRCYALTDTRQYLECLYGAVQPLRNDLGLPQAPQASSFASLFARPASPVASPSPAAPMVTAPARPASLQQQQQSDRGTASGLFASVMGIKTTMVPPEQFGLRNARSGPGLNVDHITAQMAQYSIDRNSGHFTVTLDNGQVWQQQAGDEHNPTWDKKAATYIATVSYGAMGTFNLTVVGERQPYKVQRVR